MNLCSLQPFGIFLLFHFPRSWRPGWYCQHSRKAPDPSGEFSSRSPGHTQHSFDTPWWDNAHSLSVYPLQSVQFDLTSENEIPFPHFENIYLKVNANSNTEDSLFLENSKSAGSLKILFFQLTGLLVNLSLSSSNNRQGMFFLRWKEKV